MNILHIANDDLLDAIQTEARVTHEEKGCSFQVIANNRDDDTYPDPIDYGEIEEIEDWREYLFSLAIDTERKAGHPIHTLCIQGNRHTEEDIELDCPASFEWAVENIQIPAVEDRLAHYFEVSVELLITDAMGVYIPQAFCAGLTEKDIELQTEDVKKCISSLAKQDSVDAYQYYWEDWETILNDYRCRDSICEYSLHQNGDLWLVNDTYLHSLPDTEREAFWESIAH